MTYQYKFTVFTPCFNSARFIGRVYQSLESQTYRNFEWIVIDDASADTTPEVIEQYIKKANFQIQFLRNTENQMIAINYNLAVSVAKGELFVPAGHDDEFIPTALETFSNIWDEYQDAEKSKLSGISCLCKDQFGNLIGDKFPSDKYLSNYIDVIFRKKIKGEKWGFIRTDVMKAFPMHTEGKYVAESLTWLEIGEKFNTIYINSPLRIYYVDQTHTSLSSTADNKIRFPEGERFYYSEILKNHLKQIDAGLIFKFKSFLNYIRFSFHCNKSIKFIIYDIKNWKLRSIVILTLFLGWPMHLIDKYRNRI
jgi:glycosyltransferase involved in cell wall biosynthesis